MHGKVTVNNRFYFLLAGLLVLLLVAPVLTEPYPGFTGTLLTATLVIALFSMSASRRFLRIAWTLVALKVALTVAGYFDDAAIIFVAESVVVFTFFLLATVFSIQRVLEGEYVDMNRIAGAIGVYMLIGLIWASLYFFMAVFDPEAFTGLSAPAGSETQHMNAVYMDLLYYSYVTLSTLGYGDVTPVSRAAQSLAYLEAISGVMYVAILVAALVGSYGNKRVAQA